MARSLFGIDGAPQARRLLALAVAGVAWGCGGPSDGATASNEGPLVLGPSEVHVLGSSPAIAVVRDIEVASDGSVWLLNSVEPLFVGFDATGTLIAEHGPQGGGPEEFRMPVGFVSGGFGAESWVVDYVRHSFIRISAPDQPWHEVPVPSDSIPPRSLMGGMDLLTPSFRTARLGDEVILPRTTGSMDSGLLAFRLASLRPDLMAFTPETGAVRNLLSLGEVLEDPAPGWAATEGGIPLWYRLWAVCGDQVRVFDRVRNVLRGFDAAGSELDPIGLPPTFDEVTPTQFARAVFPLRQAELTGAVGPRLSSADSGRVLREIAQGVQGSPRELATYLPKYVDLRCAEGGTIWIQPLDLELGGLEGGPTWIRIGPGLERREVHLPPRFDAYRFTADRIWGIQRDELDVASVAWIELR